MTAKRIAGQSKTLINVPINRIRRIKPMNLTVKTPIFHNNQQIRIAIKRLTTVITFH